MLFSEYSTDCARCKRCIWVHMDTRDTVEENRADEPDVYTAMIAGMLGGVYCSLCQGEPLVPEEYVYPLDILAVGMRVRLTQPVERYPHFRAPAGLTGTVTVVEPTVVCIKMDEPLPGAEEWDNEVVFADADHDEVDDCIAIIR